MYSDDLYLGGAGQAVVSEVPLLCQGQSCLGLHFEVCLEAHHHSTQLGQEGHDEGNLFFETF